MFNFSRSEKYAVVPETDDTDALISERSSSESRRAIRDPRLRLSLPVAVIILVVSSLLTSFVGACIGRRYPSDIGATRLVSKYSPILEDLDISYGVVQFNGSFVHENIYRQGAGPEVDAAWEALGVGFRPSIVPDLLATKSGLNKNHARRKAKYGGGYPVFVEGLHQLHCLNLLRKSLFYNYEHYHSLGEGAFGDSEPVQRWHVSHCLDFIRQRLMCTMDIGVFGSVWVNQSSPHPFVDFNTNHVCRNFDAIRQWAEEHQVPEDEDLPEDYLEIPVPGDGVKVWELAP